MSRLSFQKRGGRQNNNYLLHDNQLYFPEVTSGKSQNSHSMAEWGKGDPRWIVEERPDGSKKKTYLLIFLNI
jgi:hypothetical protein